MLFIFYIIISTFTYILGFNCFSVYKKEAPFDEDDVNSNYNDTEKENYTNSGSVMSKHKSLLHIIENPGKAPNLKANIFDKMLSNEMLSIKQQLYVRNESTMSPIYITFKNSMATPTLELRQRWPVENLSALDIKSQNEGINGHSQIYTTADNRSKMYVNYYDNKKIINHSKVKVLGVRSFTSASVHLLENSHNHQYTKGQCTCMKTNHRTTCSSRCSGTYDRQKATCTQVDKFVTAYPECTRNVMPLTYYPYYLYSPLFLGVTTDSSVVYYHPDVVNKLKLPKHKHSKNKNPTIDNLYFENDDSKQTYENEYFDYISKHKSKKKKNPKNNSDKVKKVYFIDYKEKNQMSDRELPKLNDGYLQVLDRDKFVENVVEDLRMYYSNAIIKDCYCSQSPLKLRIRNLFICILTLTTLFMHNDFT